MRKQTQGVLKHGFYEYGSQVGCSLKRPTAQVNIFLHSEAVQPYSSAPDKCFVAARYMITKKIINSMDSKPTAEAKP